MRTPGSPLPPLFEKRAGKGADGACTEAGNPYKKTRKTAGDGDAPNKHRRPLPSVGMIQTGSKGRAIALSAENRHPQRQYEKFVLVWHDTRGLSSLYCDRARGKLVKE